MLKKTLYQECWSYIDHKHAITETIMKENREAMDQESKSSAGDKHETGRAMLHLEMEKASQQLEVINKMKAVLQRIDVNNSSERIILGSIVTTDQGVYFLAISAGELLVDGKSYFAISPSSPIGSKLIGKEIGASVILGSKEFKILSIE